MKKLLILIIVFAAFSVSLAATEKIGSVTKKEGTTDVLRSGALPAEKLEVGMDIFKGDIVRTKRKSKLQITFFDGNIAVIGERSRVDITGYSFQAGNNTQVIKLTRGKVRAIVNRNKPVKVSAKGKKKFEVHTMNAVAGVRGTDFVVLYDKGVTGIVTTEGLLYVYNRFVPEDVKDIPAGSARIIKLKKKPGNLEKLQEGQLKQIINDLKPEIETEKTDDYAKLDSDTVQEEDNKAEADDNDDADVEDGDNADNTVDDVAETADNDGANDLADSSKVATAETNSSLVGRWIGYFGYIEYGGGGSNIYHVNYTQNNAKSLDGMDSDQYRKPETGATLDLDGSNYHTIDQAADGVEYYSYVAWGEWKNPAFLAGDSTNIGWVIGRVTEATEIPQTGTATYTGDLAAYWVPLSASQGYTAPVDLKGTSIIQVNFGTNIVNGTLNMTLENSTAYLTADLENATLNADGTYTGVVSGDTGYIDATSFYKGRLYGPNAEETGGMYVIYNTNSATDKNGYILGGYKAKK